MLRRNRRGAAAIEFGLWLPIIVVILSGIIDYGLLMNANHVVMRAARDGARAGASVRTGNEAEAVALAKQFAQEILAQGDMACSDCVVADQIEEDNGFQLLEVRVNAPYQPILGLVPAPDRLRYNFAVAMELQRLN